MTVTPRVPLPDQTEKFQRSMASLTESLGGRIAFGGDYNPEQWPEHVWPEDVALMREAGVNLVSLGIFSWAWLEPKQGHFEFGWLDRIVELLHAGGISIDLANASATPPPWFSRAFPQSLPVDVDGVRRSYGGRQAFCPSSPEYRAAAAALTTAIAERYADHPAVVMWHVHNEYGCHNWDCYCDVSAAAFRAWLQRRYGDLDELNDAWGTAFWSQRYYDWAEVIPPRRPSYNTFANPTQQLDFARFSSDELLDCYRAEAAIIRSHSDRPVTTNFMGFFKPLDYWRWSQEMDLVSNDHYRIAEFGSRGATHDLAMVADLIRSVSDRTPWLLMEHSTSAVNWQRRNPAKSPGQMRRDSLTHVARGADGALFFQWRASQAGAEKFHSGMLPHAGTDSARWREVRALGADLNSIAAVTGSRTQADIAIVFDWEAWWGVELDSHPSMDVNQLDRVRRWHRSLWEGGYTCDFVHPDRDLARYKVVLVPALYLTTDEGGANIAAVVERGGTVIVGYFSGVVDPNDHIRLGGYPGAFRELLGVRTEEFSPLMAGEQVDLIVAPALSEWARSSATIWTELVGKVDDDVEVLASFGGGNFAGHPVVTRRTDASTAGSAWYVATELSDQLLFDLLRRAATAAGVSPVLSADQWPADFDAVVREDDRAQYLFAINSSGADVEIDWAGTDLLTGRAWSPGDVLTAGDAAVIAAPIVR